MSLRTDPRWMTALARGARKRCPRCGDAPLFRSWYGLRPSCERCELVFEPSPGDTWGFWVIGDRAFLLLAIAALFFGFTPESWWLRAAFFAVIGGGIVLSMPRRRGIGVALDYLSRRSWGG